MGRASKTIGEVFGVASDFAEAQWVQECSLMLAKTRRSVHDHSRGENRLLLLRFTRKAKFLLRSTGMLREYR